MFKHAVAITLLFVLLTTSSMQFQGGITGTDVPEDYEPENGGNRPTGPAVEDSWAVTERIVNANEILRKALQQFLDYRDANLTFYLNRVIKRYDSFEDEYGVVIPAYKKVFRFILVQDSEMLQGNYTVGRFDKDKLDLCSVARFLSHQPNVADRKSLMKRMGEALGYKCHPCTPYKRREHGPVEVPDTSDLDINYDDPVMCNNTYITTTTTATNEGLEFLASSTTTTANPYWPDFSPCYYSSESEFVNCYMIRLVEVKEAFELAPIRNLTRFWLTLRFPENFIPAGLIGNHRAIELRIACASNSGSKLIVDPQAFASTKDTLDSIAIHSCDLALLDLGFLAGFNNLETVEIFSETLLQSFSTLPKFPRLSRLMIGSSSLCCFQLADLPVLANGLEVVHVTSSPGFDDVSARRMLDWLLVSSRNTLKELEFNKNNELTEIPSQLGSFPKLYRLLMERIEIPVIRKDSLKFSAPVLRLSLAESGVQTIEPGAFQGNFTEADVILRDNNLTRFDAGAFQSILRQMIHGATGHINVEGNPFDCESDPCHLAWLLRDERHLLEKVISARCATYDSTLFDELDASLFENCPGASILTASSPAVIDIKLYDTTQDYSPCSYDEEKNNLACHGKRLEKVQAVFRQKSSRDLKDFDLNLRPFEYSIPANLIGTHRAENIFIICSKLDYVRGQSLTVDPAAFNSTRGFTRVLEIIFCNLGQLDFTFLNGFDNLGLLVFDATSNLHLSFPSLPPLPSLYSLHIWDLSGFSDLTEFPQLVNGLKNVSLDIKLKGAVDVGGIIDWLLDSSGKTLEILEIRDGSNVSEIPPQLESFRGIHHLLLKKARIPVVKVNSLNFSPPITYLSLGGNGVNYIEPGAFQGGNFSNAEVNLNRNNLTRFEAQVFQDVLRQMSGSNGFITLANNPFDCESNLCHLAWLLRDERYLLNSVSQARCSNDGRLIGELEGSLFGNCPCSHGYCPCSKYSFKETVGDTSYTRTGVSCDNVTLNEVKAMFHQQKEVVTHLAEIVFKLSPLEEYVPSHIAGTNHQITRLIHIECPNRNGVSVTKLKVDRDAFAFSGDATRIFRIDNCDLSNLDLGFLAGFNNLEELIFELTANLHLSFPTLPPLPALSRLSVSEVSSAFDGLIAFPVLAKGLETFQLWNLTSEKATDSIHAFINWLAVSSTDTLKTLVINGVNLSEIPPQLPSFGRLEYFSVKKAQIHVIRSNAIQFSAPVAALSFFGSGIIHIESGAFQGNFTNAEVFLNENNLTRFEADVFRPMLRQMDKGTGYLAVSRLIYPFDCESDPCHLAWILRDERRLLKSVSNARCFNTGKLFYEIEASLFANCSCDHEYCPCQEHFFDETVGDKTYNRTSVLCNNIPLNEVKQVFHQQKTDVTYLHEMALLLRPLEEYVPSNIIGTNHRITEQIRIVCSTNGHGIPLLTNKLKVDRDAFAFTKDTTRSFGIQNCDLSNLDLEFLAGFTKLEDLIFDRTANLHLSIPTLPPLQALSRFFIFGRRVSSALDEVIGFPELAKGLELFMISNLTSEKTKDASVVNGAMNWLTESSTETLKFLLMENINLSEIPTQLPSFVRLENLAIEGAQIPVIRSNSLTFFAQVLELSLTGNGINHIEPGAFRGNFTNAKVSLNKNNLTRFEVNVFRPMLRQMDKGKGFLSLLSNPLDCISDHCHLAWLLRDERRLLNSVSQARCSNDGRLIGELEGSLFGNCPCSHGYCPCSKYSFKETVGDTSYIRTGVSCDNVTLNEVKAIFHQKTYVTYLDYFDLKLRRLEEYVPSHIIGTNHRITRLIQIECLADGSGTSTTKLRVDNDAFAFTRNATRIVRIDNCDLTHLDLGFLAGFNTLEELIFELTSNLHPSFSTLPQLSTMSLLSVSEVSSAFDGLVAFPVLAKGLETFKMRNVTSKNATALIHGMMNWLTVSSTYTLETLVIFGVNTTEIPPELSSFGRLKYFQIEGAEIALIKSNALTFSDPVDTLTYSFGNGLNHIEPGAFQGNFTNAKVWLSNNNLTRFEADVFRPMLRQMDKGTGFLSLFSNPFDCESDPCHLAWILRDERRLLKSVFYARCFNTGKLINEIEASLFANCSSYGPCRDYSFKESDSDTTSVGVTCDNIPLNEVKAMFHQEKEVATHLAEIVLKLSPLEENVPSNILGINSQITRLIQIECSSNRHDDVSVTKLKVDKEAFDFTGNVTRIFRIDNCDLSEFNLGFLSKFNNLEELIFHLTPNFHRSFSTLPPLPELSRLFVMGVSSALDEFVTFPELAKGLETFKITNLTSEKATASIHGMMNWLNVSSTDTLKKLVIQDVNLWAIPEHLKFFVRLEYFYIERAQIPVVKSNSLRFSAPVDYLALENSGINHIESGAFQGNFTNAKVLLNNNNLTRFEASVFRPMLRQMSTGTGILAVNASPFDCKSDPCHLAWLFRDERHLLTHLFGAMCTKDGVETPFDQVGGSLFDSCPLNDCTESGGVTLQIVPWSFLTFIAITMFYF